MRQNPRTPLGDWTPEQRTQFNRVAVFGLLGIVIGFFLATVVWPADRSGSRLDDLQPALRAQYLSALADAYVTTAGDNAATVLSRLTDLRDPQQELSDAIVYYQGLDSETAQLHEFNLRTLQAEFGGVAGVPGAAADTSDTPQATALDTAAETPVQRTLGRASLLDWLLIGVAMAMLIGGGVWIFYQFVLMRDTNRRSTRRRDLDEDDYLDEPASADSENDDPWDYDFDDDDAQRAAGIPRPPTREEQWENWNRRSQEVGGGPLAQPAPRQPTPQQQSFIPQQAQDWEDITVETDIDVASARRAQPQTDDDAASLWSATSAEGDAALTDDTLSDDALTDDALTDDAPDFDDTPPIAPQARQLPPKSAPGAPPARRDDAPDDIQNAGRETRRRPAPGQGDTQRPRPDAPPQDSHKRDDNGIIGQVQDHLAGFRRRDRAPQPPPVLTEFKATYYHGITDYEESFT
ncbi:MAG: hypothetical protein KDD84_17420, partial [Caldilineaceae bacterium]|nr:hypothetical protein [Caldilineaceae bacterium]